MDLYTEIKEHFDKEYPREGCGLITVVKGKKQWTPVTNIAKDNDDFLMDSEEYFKLFLTTDIIGIVHNHIGDSSTPGKTDIESCNTMGIPYYIFSYPNMDLTVVEPEKSTTNLFGREYKFGVKDCFEAMRDYLLTKKIEIPRRALFEDNWYNKGLDYFCPEVIKNWGGKEIDLSELKENDVLIFRVQEEINNHCGVYIGNDVFYHHAVNRLSCRESLYPFWHQYLVGAYRYVA
jgi:proteasome lid subunit RPN8/RPN11